LAIRASCSASDRLSGAVSPALLAFAQPFAAAANSQSVSSSIWRGENPIAAPVP
jgi:hypothetical protein